MRCELGQLVPAVAGLARLGRLRQLIDARRLRELRQRLDDLSPEHVGGHQRDEEAEQQRDRRLLRTAHCVVPDPVVIDEDADGAGQSLAELDGTLDVDRFEREKLHGPVQRAGRPRRPCERSRRAGTGARGGGVAVVALQHVATLQSERRRQQFRVSLEVVERATAGGLETRRHRRRPAAREIDRFLAREPGVPQCDDDLHGQ